MPIYEYGCEKCGRDFEELVFGDETPSCPYCGSAETHKLMSRCARCRSDSGASFDMAPPSSGGGCAGCSGGNCASCGQ